MHSDLGSFSSIVTARHGCSTRSNKCGVPDRDPFTGTNRVHGEDTLGENPLLNGHHLVVPRGEQRASQGPPRQWTIRGTENPQISFGDRVSKDRGQVIRQR